MGILNQALGTVIACYVCMSVGIIFTWPSCTFKIFGSSNSTLHRPMLETELALFGSLSSIGGLISTPVAGLLLDVVGRKFLLLASSLTQVLSWAMIASCNQVEVVLTAVFITGVGGGSFLIVPIFISEICQDSIRGGMTAGSMIFYALGMLISYVLGGLLSYQAMVYVCLSVSVVGTVLLLYIKETPLYFMKKGLEEEAARSMAFYRGQTADSKLVLQELNSIRRSLNPDIEDDDDSQVSPEQVKLKSEEKTYTYTPKEKRSVWQFVKKSKSTRRAIALTLVLMTASLFQGLVVVQVYAEPLFEEAVPNISPTVCSVILAILTVVSGLVAAYFTEIAGRKPLMVYSSLGSGLCCVLLGTQLHLHWAPHWLTAVLIYLFNITYTFGAGTIPYVILPEIFLPEIKSFMAMFAVEWAWLCNFVILFIFNPLVSAIGLGPVFYLFAGVCFFTAIYSIIYQPETKGLDTEQIQAALAKKKRIGKY